MCQLGCDGLCIKGKGHWGLGCHDLGKCPVQLPAGNIDFLLGFKGVCVCSLVALPLKTSNASKHCQETKLGGNKHFYKRRAIRIFT